MIRADMESVGLYSPVFDGTIRLLAKTERELSRAEKAWKAAGGKMVAELVNKTGGAYTAKDPNYAVVDQLRKDVLQRARGCGLRPPGDQDAQVVQRQVRAQIHCLRSDFDAGGTKRILYQPLQRRGD